MVSKQKVLTRETRKLIWSRAGRENVWQGTESSGTPGLLQGKRPVLLCCICWSASAVRLPSAALQWNSKICTGESAFPLFCNQETIRWVIFKNHLIISLMLIPEGCDRYRRYGSDSEGPSHYVTLEKQSWGSLWWLLPGKSTLPLLISCLPFPCPPCIPLLQKRPIIVYPWQIVWAVKKMQDMILYLWSHTALRAFQADSQSELTGAGQAFV